MMRVRATPVTPARRALQDKAHTALRLQMTAALVSHPAARTITNPESGATTSALFAVRREFDERNCDAAELSALSIIGALALERSALGLRAANWIDARAEHWANMHCIQLAAQWAADAAPEPERAQLIPPRVELSAGQVAAMDEMMEHGA
jgi:hypothetical protein